MQENTKKYLKDALDDLEISINTIKDITEHYCKDAHKAMRKLRKFQKKVIEKNQP